MRIFGGESIDGMLQKIGLKENESIDHPWINKAMERAQKKVEGRNFDIRKTLIKFDDVMNDQRRVIFSQRLKILKSKNVEDILKDFLDEVLGNLVIIKNTYQKSNDEIIDELIYQNLEKDMTNENNSDLEEKYRFNKINLKNVSFKYSEKEKFIFEKINLEIKKGSYLGIVGGSGSGKSTLIDLITGLLNINNGSIEINGESADIKNKKWKNLFGYVPQQTNLFNDTIFANITFGKSQSRGNQLIGNI